MKLTMLTRHPPSQVIILSAMVLGVAVGCIAMSQGLAAMACLGLVMCCSSVLLMTKGVWFLLVALPVSAVFWTPLFQVGPYNVTTLYLAMAGLFTATVLRLGLNRTWRVRNASMLILLAFLPLVFGVVGSIITFGSIPNFVNGVAVYTVRFALYAILPTTFTLSPPRFVDRSESVLRWSLLIGIGWSLLGPSSYQRVAANYGNRATGLFYNPNIMGNVAVVAGNWALAGLLEKAGARKSRAVSLAIVAFSVASILRSGSRSAMVGIVVSAVAWGCALGRSSRSLIASRMRYVLVVAISVVVAFAGLVFARSIAWARIQEVMADGLATPGISGRLEAARIGINIFIEHPLGVGVGNVPLISRPYSQSLWDIGGLTTTDNQFLEILIESGVVGLIAFVAVLVVWLRRSLAARTLEGVSVAISIVAMSITGLAGFTFYSPFISSLLWIMSGVVTGKTQHTVTPTLQ